MSKINAKMIEIEDLLNQGFDVDTIAKIAQVSADFVINVDLELRGLHQHGYEDNYAISNIG